LFTTTKKPSTQLLKHDVKNLAQKLKKNKESQQAKRIQGRTRAVASSLEIEDQNLDW